MGIFKEIQLRALEEKQERGLIPKLTAEEQRRAEARIDAWAGKLHGALSDESLSDLDSLRKFGAYLQVMELGDRRALKRYWRRLKQERKWRRQQKRFR